MSNKVKRKVTVENPKDSGDQPRRPSVFERLGKGATVNIVASQPQERHSRTDQNEKCRNWQRTGSCVYGNNCRYQHDPFPNASRHVAKPEKNMDEKDLRHKVRTKRVEPKESRTGSVSPKRKSSKRSTSRSRKGEHESKIKSTVVVTRPRSPAQQAPPEPSESKKKPDGSWEDDSDDWPMDAAQLDYKEELTLERKRQQLQRELELELQKERLLNESGVTVTKTVSFSESSSTSSSSESGSRSSSSGSSSSSSEDDSDASSSSSSSSSSSGSHTPAKRRGKKTQLENKEQILKKSLDAKQRDSYEKIKIGHHRASAKERSVSPLPDVKSSKKMRDRRNLMTPSPRRYGQQQQESKVASVGKSVKIKGRGPRTPSPIHPSRKQRQWGQSSSTDSRSRSDLRRGQGGKRHKRKRDVPRNKRLKPGQVTAPPPLSSPNRTALLPMPLKKSKQRREERERARRRGRNPSPMLLSGITTSATAQPPRLLGYAQQYSQDNLDKSGLKQHSQSSDRSKAHSRKESADLQARSKQNESRDRSSRRRHSPRRDHRGSTSPQKDKMEGDSHLGIVRKGYPQAPHIEKDNKCDRRRSPISPPRGVAEIRDRRKGQNEPEKRRDVHEPSPREFGGHRDGQYHGGDGHMYDKRNADTKAKRIISPDSKKGRDDRNRDRSTKDRIPDYDNSGAWNDDHRKPSSVPGGRRTPEPHGRSENRSQPQNAPSHSDRSRDREDRKKRKERDVSVRSVDESERPRMPSPRRSQSPVHSHHSVREIEPLTGNRGRIYESDLPSGEREYAYGYDSIRDPYIERLLPPDYETDVLRGSSLYSTTDLYPPESRYRRDASLKEGAVPLLDRYGGRDRDVLSPRDVLPHRDVIDGRNEDYISDLSMDERRSFDERWSSRGRAGRDDWDLYPAIPPAPLPPHVAAALDEDRYGMPRRRRASPDWPRGRGEERDLPGAPANHRQSGRGQTGQPPKEPRSRSPTVAKGPGANRGSWGERGARVDTSRNADRHEEPSKSLDDRKIRNPRKDRVKRKDEQTLEKLPPPKEKQGTKRPHSSSPAPKDAKRRKEDLATPDITIVADKSSSSKHNRDDSRAETKSSSRSQKLTKSEPASPKSDMSHSSRVSGQEKAESSYKGSTESKTKQDKDDKKTKKNNEKPTHADDDFSDWSDDDDELLNRDDFPEAEVSNENSKNRTKNYDNIEKSNSDTTFSNKHKENSRASKDYIQDLKNKVKERGSHSRTNSKERSYEDQSHSSKDKSIEMKDIDTQETYVLKDETATDVDEYITAESVDYDPISDEELDALIEEPDDSLLKPSEEKEKSKIVDALDVNWSTLMDEKKTEFVPGFARQRFKAAHLLSRIGFSQAFAGAELSERLISLCQDQLDEENREKGENKAENADPADNIFAMEHQIASFHVAISQNKIERKNAFNQIGPFRRALCARRDLHIRKLLCKPVNKLTACVPVVYSPQYSVVDKDLYKQSLELLKQKKSEVQPQAIDVC